MSVDDVARVHLTGVVRHRSPAGWSDRGSSRRAGRRSRPAASARSCRRARAARSTMTDPGGIALHHVLGDEDRRLLAGNRGGRDDDVGGRDGLHHHLALAAVERLVLRLRVAAGVLRVAGLDRQLDEPRAEALNLFLDGRPHVVGLDARAEPPRRRDRLQSGDAGADDEHARGRDRAGGRVEHRKHARQRRRGEQHGLVAGDRRHRRQRVHALRARDARHELHREQHRAALGDRAGGVGAVSGSAKPMTT